MYSGGTDKDVVSRIGKAGANFIPAEKHLGIKGDSHKYQNADL